MSRNVEVLARMVAHQALERARRGPLAAPQARAMDALLEAIQCKRDEVQALILAGRMDTAEYRLSTGQLASWTAAWDANR